MSVRLSVRPHGTSRLPWFQASDAKWRRTALFWVVTRRVAVVYGPLLGLFVPWCDRQVTPKRRYGITTLRCVIPRRAQIWSCFIWRGKPSTRDFQFFFFCTLAAWNTDHYLLNKAKNVEYSAVIIFHGVTTVH